MKKLAILLLAILIFIAGCDAQTQDLVNLVVLGTALAIGASAIPSDDSGDWWDENDEHLEWLIWPVSEFL
jgi:hypothetical protein